MRCVFKWKRFHLCSIKHVPGLIERAGEMMERGVKEILCVTGFPLPPCAILLFLLLLVSIEKTPHLPKESSIYK